MLDCVAIPTVRRRQKGFGASDCGAAKPTAWLDYLLHVVVLLPGPQSHSLVRDVTNVTVIVRISFFVKVQIRGVANPWNVFRLCIATSLMINIVYYKTNNSNTKIGMKCA